MSYTMPGPVQPTQDIGVARKDLAGFGYCVLFEAISSTRVQALRQRVEQQSEAECRRGLGWAYGGAAEKELPPRQRSRDLKLASPSNRWVSMLVNKGQVFLDLLENDSLHQLLEDFLGTGFLLSSYAAHLIHPGIPPRPVCHTDQWWMPRPYPRDSIHRPAGNVCRNEFGKDQGERDKKISPPVVAQVLWPLTDFTDESGGTRLVPGSHLSGEEPDPEAAYSSDSITVAAPAGTAIIFDGRLWHGAGANRGSSLRIGLFATYCAGMFRQLENYVLGTATDIVANASPQLLTRLGFQPWQAYGRLEQNTNNFISFERDYVGELRD